MGRPTFLHRQACKMFVPQSGVNFTLLLTVTCALFSSLHLLCAYTGCCGPLYTYCVRTQAVVAHYTADVTESHQRFRSILSTSPRPGTSLKTLKMNLTGSRRNVAYLKLVQETSVNSVKS
jgi:hypothetical protein